MRVLALDSTTRAGSVAVVEDDGIMIERMGDGTRPHAERLPGDVTDLGIPLSSVDVFAVASGPGLFTGLRIGIATIQGFAFALGKRVAAVSALDALAQLGSRGLKPGALVGAWMDAHRHDVFSALYRVTNAEMFSDQRLIEVDPYAVDEPAVTLARWTDLQQVPVVIVGDGAMKYTELIGNRAGVVTAPALAGAIGAIAIHRARAGRTTEPAGVQPVYIRRPDAELARDRAQHSVNAHAPGTQG